MINHLKKRSYEMLENEKISYEKPVMEIAEFGKFVAGKSGAGNPGAGDPDKDPWM